MIYDACYPAMGGQIIDATLVAAPRQRNKDSGKEAIKAGRILEAWKGSMEGKHGRTGRPNYGRRIERLAGR